jgi:hypothetical protein
LLDADLSANSDDALDLIADTIERGEVKAVLATALLL